MEELKSAYSKSFCSPVDVETFRGTKLGNSEFSSAIMLTEMATALVKAEAPYWQDVDPMLLKTITVSMVTRALNGLGEHSGISQTSQTVGDLTESFTFVQNQGLSLTANERRILETCAPDIYEGFFHD